MINRHFQIQFSLLTVFCLTVFFGLLLHKECQAADRLYFTSIVEHSPVSANPRVILEWGALEGSVPAEITDFKIYRSTSEGSYLSLITGDGRIPAQLLDSETLRGIILDDDNTDRRTKLITTLNHMSVNGVQDGEPDGPAIDASNFHTYLHDVLNPASTEYDPLQRMLLIRQFPHVAIAAGLGFIDEDVTTDTNYKYMLTAVKADTSESLPVGQTETITVNSETVLPAPQGLDQVEVNDCSSIRKGIDDLMIHLRWDIPDRPQDIGHNILVYGYDLFWSESDLGSLDFRQEIPAELTKLNDKPIIVSGPPPATGPDSFLAKDDGTSHLTGPQWQRGQSYFYYLAALDIAGHYSDVSATYEATVVDGVPPAMPWNIHTEELTTLTSSGGGQVSTPRLAIAWDQINPLNYTRYYGTGKNICSSDASEVCYTRGEESCGDPAKIRCVDLDVVEYRIFRFTSPKSASLWGVDTDGDLWPDDQEEGLSFDPCDADDKPAVNPPEYVETIDQNNPLYLHSIAEQHLQMNYLDFAMQPDDYVYWYKIIAVDSAGNQSSVSPPVRAVLHDRSQPVPSATLEVCSGFQVDKTFDMTEQVPGDALVLIDETGVAASFSIFEKCSGTQQEPDIMVIRGTTTGRVTHVDKEILSRIDCQFADCSNFYVVFYDQNGKRIGVSEDFNMDNTNLCSESFYGTITLQDTCTSWGLSKPGLINVTAARVCVDLGADEFARIYHRIGDEMSPFISLPQQGTAGIVCENLPDFAGLSSAELCLGVRAFSKNHVGSGMQYLDCLEKPVDEENEPPAPLMEGAYSREEQGSGDPYFELRWAAPAEGASLFILAVRRADSSQYKTIWDAAQDDSGQFSYIYQLDPLTEIGQELCFKMRTMNSAMQSSDWSAETCETWTAVEPPNLPWPWMKEPAQGSDFTAFYLNEHPTLGGRPAIVMSNDLATSNYLLAAYPLCEDETLTAQVQTCSGTGQCTDDNPEVFNLPCSSICDNLVPRLSSFIVYRQEEGKDFVQVSPLLNRFACFQTREKVFAPQQQHYEWVTKSTIQDPFIYLRNIESNVVGGGVDPAFATGVRLIFVDRYPYRANSKVRYKILEMDDESGEIAAEHKTNWFNLQ